MASNFKPRPAPSVLLGAYPQRKPAAAGVFTALEFMVDRLLWRMRFRKSSQRKALGTLRIAGHSSQPMSNVIEAWEISAGVRIGDEVVAAAEAMQCNRALVELTDAIQSEQAAHLAALAMARVGVPVHLVYDVSQTIVSKTLMATSEQLGVSLANLIDGQTLEQRRQAYSADIVLVSFRQLMFDYLLDQRLFARHRGAISGRLQQYIIDCDGPMLSGLSCALVVDARAVLIESARQPMALSDSSGDANSHTLSFYLEAIQCAGQLIQGQDFLWGESGRIPVLLESTEHRLRDLTRSFGPLWRGASRTKTIISAALIVLQLKENSDYTIADGKPALRADPTRYADLEGLTISDYKQLIQAKHDLPGSSTNPVVSSRLSLQHFFPRYLHLAAAGWLLQPRRSELEEVYELFSVPRLSPKQSATPELSLCKTTHERYRAAGEILKTSMAGQHNILLLHKDPAEQNALHCSLDQRSVSALLTQNKLGEMDEVGGLFLSLTYEELLVRIGAGDTPGVFHRVIFVDTPATTLDELLVCDHFCASDKFLLLASPDEDAFALCSKLDRALMPFSSRIYRLLRKKIDQREQQLRAQVAAHDAYVRQTLAFSGNID